MADSTDRVLLDEGSRADFASSEVHSVKGSKITHKSDPLDTRKGIGHSSRRQE